MHLHIYWFSFIYKTYSNKKVLTVVSETKAKYMESRNVQFSISTNIPAGIIINTTIPGMR